MKLEKLADKIVLLVAVLSIFATGFICGLKFYQLQETQSVIVGVGPDDKPIFARMPSHKSWLFPTLPYE